MGKIQIKIDYPYYPTPLAERARIAHHSETYLHTVNDKISDPVNNGYIESWNKIIALFENHVTK